MSQWLRVCTLPPEVLGSVPSTHAWPLTTICNDLKSLACVLPEHPHSHVHTLLNMHTKLKNYKSENLLKVNKLCQ